MESLIPGWAVFAHTSDTDCYHCHELVPCVNPGKGKRRPDILHIARAGNLTSTGNHSLTHAAHWGQESHKVGWGCMHSKVGVP